MLEHHGTRLAAEHVYLIPVLSLHVLLAFLVCLLLPEMSTEVLECHSTQSDGSQRVKPTRFVCILCASVLSLTLLMALVDAGKALAAACQLKLYFTCVDCVNV